VQVLPTAKEVNVISILYLGKLNLGNQDYFVPANLSGRNFLKKNKVGGTHGRSYL
jgi:hypothetical protein